MLLVEVVIPLEEDDDPKAIADSILDVAGGVEQAKRRGGIGAFVEIRARRPKQVVRIVQVAAEAHNDLMGKALASG